MTTVTITGDTGPGIAIAAGVYSDVVSFSFEPNAVFKMVRVSGVVNYFDITTETTITITKSGANYTVTIAT